MEVKREMEESAGGQGGGEGGGFGDYGGLCWGTPFLEVLLDFELRIELGV